MKKVSCIINCLFFTALLFVQGVYSNSVFSNFSSTIRVNDIVAKDSIVWAATRGGLIKVNLPNNKVDLLYGSDKFPDLYLTALCFDPSGNLWIGTKLGYLIKKTPRGSFTICSSYYSAKWGITALYSYKNYLIIGSNKGCSVYDPSEEKAIQNATSFKGFKSPMVYAITVFKDTLYLGLDNGVAKLDVSGNNLKTKPFVDDGIWDTLQTDSSVVSMPVLNGRISFVKSPSAVWNNKIIYSIDSCIYSDTTFLYAFPSKVSFIYTDNDRQCWIGTDQHSLYKWNGTDTSRYQMNWIPFRSTNRVYVAKDGTVWCVGNVKPVFTNSGLHRWWQGIAAYNGTAWSFFNEKTKGLGWFGDGNEGEFYGVADDPQGNMWFGPSGAHLKKYSKSTGLWSRYQIDNKIDNLSLYTKDDFMVPGWGKSDAIAQDSSGYMWFASWSADGGGPKGCVFVYDTKQEVPTENDFRYFFPKGSINYEKDPYVLNVDATGTILMGSEIWDNGKLIVFNYKNNPLQEDMNVVYTKENLKKVWDMASIPRGKGTWIATGVGLYYYEYNKQVPQFVAVDKSPLGLTSVEFEHDTLYAIEDFINGQIGDSARGESWVWLGTQLEGVKQILLTRLVDRTGRIASIRVDSTKTYTVENGLLSNIVNSLAMDRKNGYLWIATDNGVSRLTLGHSFIILTNNANIAVYPNPFSRSRHKEIVFAHVAPASVISIYSLDGRLITRITERGSNVKITSNEWTFFWKPDPSIIPGTYFYSARPGSASDGGSVRKRPAAGKILILP